MTTLSSAAIAPLPSAANYVPPPGACDCHCHVLGPYSSYPLAATHTYLSPEAPASQYLAMLDQLGMSRGVLIQASVHGLDNSAMLYALDQAPSRLRGVAVVAPETASRDLRILRDRGVRGLRLSRLLKKDGSPMYENTIDVSALPGLLPAMRDLELHAQLWITLDQLRSLAPLIRTAGIPFVIDHMGRSDPSSGISDPDFRLMCELLSEGNLWVKLTPYRASRQPPSYADVRPLHEHLIQINPDRLVWGSDWPHVNMQEHRPDAGGLLDTLRAWTLDDTTLGRILVDNPATLYGFTA